MVSPAVEIRYEIKLVATVFVVFCHTLSLVFVRKLTTENGIKLTIKSFSVSNLNLIRWGNTQHSRYLPHPFPRPLADGLFVKICKFVFIFHDLIFKPRVIKKREKIEGILVGNITKNVIRKYLNYSSSDFCRSYSSLHPWTSAMGPKREARNEKRLWG